MPGVYTVDPAPGLKQSQQTFEGNQHRKGGPRTTIQELGHDGGNPGSHHRTLRMAIILCDSWGGTSRSLGPEAAEPAPPLRAACSGFFYT
ncbi:hypothetical protein VULLAG_LOCUS7166 [Vulpes lagopus]